MNEQPQVALSPALAAVLHDFRAFVIGDDSERAEALEAADTELLAAFGRAITPLFPEIDTLLDRLTSMTHPLPVELEFLEADLNSLGEAGAEARLTLLERDGG